MVIPKLGSLDSIEKFISNDFLEYRNKKSQTQQSEFGILIYKD